MQWYYSSRRFRLQWGFLLNMLTTLSIATQRRYRWMKDLAVIVSKKLITDKNKLTVNDKTMHATQIFNNGIHSTSVSPLIYYFSVIQNTIYLWKIFHKNWKKSHPEITDNVTVNLSGPFRAKNLKGKIFFLTDLGVCLIRNRSS